MFDFLQQTIEYQNFGYNVETFTALGTVLFTCLQLMALVQQYRTIKTGKSVSVTWNTYFAAHMIAFFFYAAYAGSIAMMFNALLGLGHLLVLWGLRVKQFSKREYALLPTILIMPYLMYRSGTDLVNLQFVELEQRQLLFLLFSTGSLVALAMPAWELYSNKSRGDASFYLLLSYTAATGFWLGFAYFATDDLAFRFIVSVASAELVLTMYLWLLYPAKRNRI